MKTVFFESLRYKLITTKNDFYYGSCPDIHLRKVWCLGDSQSHSVAGRGHGRCEGRASGGKLLIMSRKC